MPNTNDLYRRGLSPDNETERNNAILKALLYTRVLVPVEPDEIKAADAFNAEMVRITGKSSAVEMRAIHAALRAGVGEQT